MRNENRMADGNRNIWLDGVMGVVTGDALGCPVQFRSRKEIARDPVTGMRGFGTYNMPAGTWTDDSSMSLATLASIREKGCIDLGDIMARFAAWLTKGEYTPFGKSFDIGRGTMAAIRRYLRSGDFTTCGGTTERDNGNGSIMRILPVCLYCCEEQAEGRLKDDAAVALVHAVAGLTHNHLRGQIACGLYFFMARSVLSGEGDLKARLKKGLEDGFAFYARDPKNHGELVYYQRLRSLDRFASLSDTKIRSSGYVVDTIEAAVWSLLNAKTFQETLLTAVNLGDDTDSVGAVAGGLAGLYYGYGQIPAEWLEAIRKREQVEAMLE